MVAYMCKIKCRSLHKFGFLLLSTAISITSSAAFAEKFPLELQGIWKKMGEDIPEPCKASDWGSGDEDGSIKVQGDKVEYYESACELKVFKSPAGTFRCAGEGLLWDTQELWNVLNLSGRRTLIVTVLKRSGEREGDTKSAHRAPDKGPYPPDVYQRCD